MSGKTWMLIVVMIVEVYCKDIQAPYDNGEPENFVTDFVPYYSYTHGWRKYSKQQIAIEDGELGLRHAPYWIQADQINRPTHIFPQARAMWNPRATFAERFTARQKQPSLSANEVPVEIVSKIAAKRELTSSEHSPNKAIT